MAARGARQLLRTLAALALVWTPLQFLVWSSIQPWYTARVAGAASAILAVLEHGDRVTTLRPDRGFVHLATALTPTEDPVTTFSGDRLHFHGVLLVSLALVWPGFTAVRRVRVVALTVAGLFVFHVAALLIKVEHTYAVTMIEVSARHYSDAERWCWSWLHDTAVYFAIQLVPACGLVILFATRSLGVSGSPGIATPRDARGGAILAATLVALAGAGLFLLHAPRIAARQAEKESRLGFLALAQGEPARASERFEAALRLCPRVTEAHIGLGDASIAQGKADEAAAHYRRALDAGRNQAAVLVKLGNALIAGGDSEGAIASYRSALQHEPLREARINLAIALRRADRLEEAEPPLRALVDSDPDDADALFHLSAVLIGTGRECEALPPLLRLQGLGPAPARAGLVTRSLEDLRGRCGAGN